MEGTVPLSGATGRPAVQPAVQAPEGGPINATTQSQKMAGQAALRTMSGIMSGNVATSAMVRIQVCVKADCKQCQVSMNQALLPPSPCWWSLKQRAKSSTCLEGREIALATSRSCRRTRDILQSYPSLVQRKRCCALNALNIAPFTTGPRILGPTTQRKGQIFEKA